MTITATVAIRREFARRVQALEAVLWTAAQVNAGVRELWEKADELFGGGSANPLWPLHWSELNPETASKASPFANWRRFLLLDQRVDLPKRGSEWGDLTP